MSVNKAKTPEVVKTSGVSILAEMERFEFFKAPALIAKRQKYAQLSGSFYKCPQICVLFFIR